MKEGYLWDKREMGYAHVDSVADLPSPMDLRNKLVNTVLVSAPHFSPQPGWVIYWIKGEKMLALRPSNQPSDALRYI